MPLPDIDNFVRYTNDLDRSRRQDIRESLPELYELWTRHRPWDHEAFRHYGNEAMADRAAADEAPMMVEPVEETALVLHDRVVEAPAPVRERAPIVAPEAVAPALLAPATVAEVLAFARQAIATLTGVPADAVRVGVKLDYEVVG